MQKITPFLWFDNAAEEAMKFYTSIFKNSKIGSISLYGENGPAPAGTVMAGMFELDGQEFMALNGGPTFHFSEAISFLVSCEDQPEIDYFWDKLSEDGEQRECGWLKDKFGVSWQIVPKILGEMMSDRDPEKSARVMKALLKMSKIEISILEKAYAEK